MTKELRRLANFMHIPAFRLLLQARCALALRKFPHAVLGCGLGDLRPVDLIKIWRIDFALRPQCFRNWIRELFLDFAPAHGVVGGPGAYAIGGHLDGFFLEEFMEVDLMVFCGARSIGAEEVPHEAYFHGLAGGDG